MLRMTLILRNSFVISSNISNIISNLYGGERDATLEVMSVKCTRENSCSFLELMYETSATSSYQRSKNLPDISHFASPRLVSPQYISFHLISPRFISFHFISSPLNSSHRPCQTTNLHRMTCFSGRLHLHYTDSTRCAYPFQKNKQANKSCNNGLLNACCYHHS